MFLVQRQLALAAVVCMLAISSPASAGAKTSHPVVPGFERFHAKDAGAAGGRLLLGELNCISCHRPDASLESSITPRKAPILDGVGQRIQRTYLRKFLADPQAVKPGTTMPSLFAAATENERDEQIEALVHFLSGPGALPREKFDRKSIGLGKTLYHTVGCVACHGSRDDNGNQAKTWATVVPLGDVKSKYSLTSLRTFLENPLHTRPSARMPGLLNAAEAKQVANYLIQGMAGEKLPTNLKYSYYEGSWAQVPNFTKLKPKASGTTYGFDLGLAPRQSDFAMKFDGYLKIDRAGAYQFHLTSDDGSLLHIDDKLIVNNDGVHAPGTKSGKTELKAGMHKLQVGFFQVAGGVELNLDIAGPGLGQQDIVPYLYLNEDGVQPAAKQEAKVQEKFVYQPKLAERGRELFTTIGCASCHELHADKKLLATKLTALPLAKVKGEAGCLDKQPAKGVPHYVLSPAQKTALAAALKSGAPKAEDADVKVQVARTLTTFNCYACHQRDKIGGVEDGANPFFITSDQDLADEGRLPPTLTGVGAKLNTPYFKDVLDKGAHDRPYMQTRMPRFGDANVGHLVTLLPKIDKLPAVAEVDFKRPMAKVKSEGRHLVGAQALGCIKCHTFAGKKAEGIQGIDMTIMTTRVKHDWFHYYLRDPASFRPLTRMPTAWPGGLSTLPKILDGDANKQIEAIWDFLADGKKALMPIGIGGKNFILLSPDKEAIIYRNFVQGAGSRAIAVGYPEKAHLAFDANDIRLAMLWQGAFMDAGRHWTGRGEGYEPPLGENLLHLPPGVSFAVLVKETDPWPTKSARDLGIYKFQGYKLGEDQRPTFLYTIGDVRVEDFPTPVAGKNAVTMVRTFHFTAGQNADNLTFRAASASKIEALGDGWYRIGTGDSSWKMRIESAVPPRIRANAGGMELLVPVTLKDGKGRIVQEFAW